MTQAIIVDNLLPQQLRIDYHRGDNSAMVFVILRHKARIHIEGIGYEQLSENVRLVMEPRNRVRVRVLPRDVVGNRPVGPIDYVVTGAPSAIAGTGTVTGYFHPSKAVTGTVSGTGVISDASYVTVSLDNDTLSGSVIGAKSITGNIHADVSSTGTVSGTKSVNGNARANARLIRTVSGIGAITGNLDVTIAVSTDDDLLGLGILGSDDLTSGYDDQLAEMLF